MKTQHTPGPWSVKKASPQAGIIIAPNRSLGIAEVFGGGETDISNARLIASAPELLSALEFLLADYIAIDGEELTGSAVPVEKARVAIAKAKGEI